MWNHVEVIYNKMGYLIFLSLATFYFGFLPVITCSKTKPKYVY